MVYYALFYSLMSYALIFWVNSTNSKCVFKLQKKAIRIIIGAKNNDSCGEFCKLLKILPLSAQYIYSLLMFVASNENLFLDNLDLHSIKTRNIHYARIRIFNQLPTSIKCSE
jgi:hypothetical protein